MQYSCFNFDINVLNYTPHVLLKERRVNYSRLFVDVIAKASKWLNTHLHAHTYTCIHIYYIYIYKLIYLTIPTEEEIIYAITLFESPVNVDHKMRNETGKLNALFVRITNDVNRS